MATNKRVAKRQHRWLSSVEITGVVLSEPVLADAGNFRSLDKAELANFRKQREIWNLPKGMVEGDGQPAWIDFILEDFLGLKDTDYWQVGASIPSNMVVALPEQQETLRPSRILLDEGQPIMLLLEVPREQSLDKSWLQGKGRWKASPTTKFDRLLRETGIELGLLTNGEAWRLVVASPSETTSWVTWTAQTWNDDPLTLAAFKDLFGESRFFAGPRDQVVLELIKQSRQRQLDVADQLGNQVLEALQILVHELDRVDAELGGTFLQGYGEAEIFESSVAFIMRLLFTLYAEENGLLPHGNVNYDRAYGVLHLLTELEETERLAPEKLKHSFAAYARLLASSHLLHDGSIDPDIRIAAHGGQLFDPHRYLLLDGRTKEGVWPTEIPEPPKIRDATIRDILRSLKYAKADGVRQLVSYRTLAVEQIGHMYEGLLDRRVARAPANSTLLLLQGGSKIKEPEPVGATMFAGLDQAALIKTITKHTSKTAGTIRKILERDEERHTLANLGTDDAELLEQAKPAIRFVKDLGIVRPSGLYVCQGQDRRSSGAHYTPPTLTEPVVRRTLEHHVYVNVEGKPGLLQEPRLIKTPQEILSLKVCDPAMGSGAFLVQATRYLSERLVDAWERIAAEKPDAILTMPFATPSQAEGTENLMPETREERIVFARRYVAERCVYGVDINRLAVEMAKLSLWLTTLSTDRPFTFVDHALKHGNSLVGLSPEQIRNFTWKPISNDFGPLFANAPKHEVEEAEQHREAIHDIPDHDFIRKEQKHRIAEEAVANVRLKVILAIAAFINGANNKQREANLIEYRYWFERIEQDEKANTEVDKIIRQLTTGDNPVMPFCWDLEFPEVFSSQNAGFDVLLGNPPFITGTKIASSIGKTHAKFLEFQNSQFGNRANYCALFLRLGEAVLGSKGVLGFLVTNTLSEGDSRESGFDYLLSKGFSIYNAKTNFPWPGKASLHIHEIEIQKETPYLPTFLNGDPVDNISSFLTTDQQLEKPGRLNENVGISHTGERPYDRGGFILDKNTLADLDISKDDIENYLNMGILKKYLTGDDLNNKGKPTNLIMDFNNLSLDQVIEFPELYSRIEEIVLPYRKSIKEKKTREFWWKYQRCRPKLREAQKTHRRLLATPGVTKYLNFFFVHEPVVFHNNLCIFELTEWDDYAVMHSSFFDLWARKYSSTHDTRLKLSTEDAFETFPRPERGKISKNIIDLATALHQYKIDASRKNDIKISKAIDLIHRSSDQSASIKNIRDIIKSIDQKILSAYGWNDVSIDFDFSDVRVGDKVVERFSWSDEAKREILKRLSRLNKKRSQSITQVT